MSGTKVPRDPNLSPELRRFLDDLSRLADTLNAAANAPASASYVTLGTDTTLTSERVLTAGSGIGVTDAGAGSTVTVSVAAGAVLQVLQNTYATSADLNPDIPLDDTAPTSSEGTEVLTQAITLANAANKVMAQVNVWGAVDTINTALIVALFNGTTCIQVASHTFATTNFPACISFNVLETPGSVGPHTYSVRVGPSTGIGRLNGSAVARQYGGAAKSTLTLMEIKG